MTIDFFHGIKKFNKKMIRRIKKLYKRIKKKVGRVYSRAGLAKSIVAFLEMPFIWVVRHRHWKIDDNKIVFITPTDLMGNSFVLFEHVLNNNYNEKYKIVFLTDRKDLYKDYKRSNVKFVKKNRDDVSIKTYNSWKNVMTAKYIFYTHSSDIGWVNFAADDQVFVNLWHGCGFKSNIATNHTFFDYCIVPGDLFIDCKSKFFGCTENKILPFGYPVYDQFAKNKGQFFTESIKEKSKSDKLIIWMPTYRTTEANHLCTDTLSSEIGLPILETEEELKEINEYCKENKVHLVIKSHRLQSYSVFDNNEFTNITFITDEDLIPLGIHIYDVLPSSDALLTDYSSIGVDYLLLDKPVGYTLDDFEGYRDKRGFVIDDPRIYMPGEHIYNKADFYKFFQDVCNGNDVHANDRKDIIHVLHNECTNHCEKIIEFLGI